MLLIIDSDYGLELIESPELIREDRVIPGHFRPCPNSPYMPGYDWIHRYAHRLARFLDPLLKVHHAELTCEKGLLYQALSNAFDHAHRKKPLKAITVSVLLGRTGLIIRVSDGGKGFNVPRVYKHFICKKRHFNSAGRGIRSMAASTRFGAFYNQKGTQINLLYLFENGLSRLSSDLIAAVPGQQSGSAGKGCTRCRDQGHRFAFLIKYWFFGGMFAVLLLGQQFPVLGGTIKPLTKPLIFGALLVMGIGQDYYTFISSIKDFKAIVFCLFSSFAVMPLLGYAIGQLFFSSNPLMFTGMMISSAVSTTMVSAIVWTGITKGNESLAMVLSIISSIACMFAAPFVLYVSLKATVEIPVAKMIKDLLVIIILPVVLSQVIRHFLKVDGKKLAKISKILGQGIILCIILMATSTPKGFGFMVILSVLGAAGMQYLTISIFSYKASRLFSSKSNAIAIMYCSSQKALSTAALICMTYFDPATSIYVLVYHIFQQIMGQVSAKILVKESE